MEKFIRYQPLFVMVLLAALAAAVLGAGFMPHFMGLVFISFAMFKLFDLGGFVRGFGKYDLITRALRPYGFVYPFLELGLGLAYLAQWTPAWLLMATVALMLISMAGVLREVARGNQFNCACLGTILSVPLSTVSVVENLAMAAMAGAMLAMY